jgi:hypothetical protein
VPPAAAEGLQLRAANVSATAWLWLVRDLGPGISAVGAGLATLPRRPREGLARAGGGLLDATAGALFAVAAMLAQVGGALRPLREDELAAGRLVFADTIPWHRVRVHDGSVLARAASRRRPTAVVTMRVVHAPPRFRTDTAKGRAWLVHELMHVWQGQHTGPSSMARALVGQWRGGYDYGGERGLLRHAEQGLAAFNPEQQADIMRGYYLRAVTGRDVAAFEPYVDEVRTVSGRSVG